MERNNEHYHQWFNSLALQENQNGQNHQLVDNNRMYWDPALPHLVPENPSSMLPNFDNLLPHPTNNVLNNSNALGFNNINGFSTNLGYGASAQDFSDPFLHDDTLAGYFNDLGISDNNDRSSRRAPYNFLPGVGSYEYSVLEQKWLNKYDALLTAQQYMMRHSYLNNTTNKGFIYPHDWNPNGSNSRRSMERFAYGFDQNRSITSSTSQRNGLNRISRSTNGSARQRHRPHEMDQDQNLMCTIKHIGSVNGSSSRQHVPSYYSLPFEQLRGQVVFMAKEHIGCKFLKKKIDEGKKEEIDMIFDQVMKEDHDYLRELMLDQFGSEVIQKLVDGTNREQHTRMLNSIIRDDSKLKDTCNNQHSSRVMQNLLGRVDTLEQQLLFTRIIKRITIPLCKTQPGHFVIQVCLKHFSPECTKDIVELVLDNCLGLAKERFGCVVVQNSLDCVSYSDTKEHLLAELIQDARVLSEDLFGNYVVQHIIGLNIPHVTSDLLGKLQGYFANLSMNKFGSNVVERGLEEGGEENVNMIVNELINSSEFLNVLQDPFGNFVAQTALKVSKGSVHNALVNVIRSNYPHLHSHMHGKRVLDITRNCRYHV